MVLLLLVVVTQLALTLSRHPALCLSHLVRIVGPRRVALVLVEALHVRGRVGAAAVVLADRVVALGAAHTLVCNNSLAIVWAWRVGMRTVFGVWARCRRAAHHGHRLATSAASVGRESGPEWLSALDEVLVGAVNLYANMLARVQIHFDINLPTIGVFFVHQRLPPSIATYPQTARQRHWPRACLLSSSSLDPCYSVSLGR